MVYVTQSAGRLMRCLYEVRCREGEGRGEGGVGPACLPACHAWWGPPACACLGRAEAAFEVSAHQGEPQAGNRALQPAPPLPALRTLTTARPFLRRPRHPRAGVPAPRLGVAV